MKYSEAPKKVQDYIKELNEGCVPEELFEDGFEGVYDSLKLWYTDRCEDFQLEDFEEFKESLGETLDAPYFDYVEADGKYFCFCWA